MKEMHQRSNHSEYPTDHMKHLNNNGELVKTSKPYLYKYIENTVNKRRLKGLVDEIDSNSKNNLIKTHLGKEHIVNKSVFASQQRRQNLNDCFEKSETQINSTNNAQENSSYFTRSESRNQHLSNPADDSEKIESNLKACDLIQKLMKIQKAKMCETGITNRNLLQFSKNNDFRTVREPSENENNKRNSELDENVVSNIHKHGVYKKLDQWRCIKKSNAALFKNKKTEGSTMSTVHNNNTSEIVLDETEKACEPVREMQWMINSTPKQISQNVAQDKLKLVERFKNRLSNEDLARSTRIRSKNINILSSPKLSPIPISSELIQNTKIKSYNLRNKYRFDPPQVPKDTSYDQELQIEDDSLSFNNAYKLRNRNVKSDSKNHELKIVIKENSKYSNKRIQSAENVSKRKISMQSKPKGLIEEVIQPGENGTFKNILKQKNNCIDILSRVSFCYFKFLNLHKFNKLH